MSSRPVVVLDLGMGNLRSVARALDRAGGRSQVSDDPDVIARAERLVMPGQGQFRDCALALAGARGDAVRAFLATGRPYLGICLGMQALFGSSEEAPGTVGLGVVPGEVRRFSRGLRDPATSARLKVPHMGWNQVEGRHPAWRGGGWFYFVHSFHCVPSEDGWSAGTSDHGGAFCAAVARDNMLACQFHPEKSGADGLALLSGFLEARWS